MATSNDISYINALFHEKHPEAKVQCCKTEDRGRIVRATGDVPAGHNLFTDEPLLVVRVDESHSVWRTLQSLHDQDLLVFDVQWYWIAVHSLLAEECGEAPLIPIDPAQQKQFLLLFAPEAESVHTSIYLIIEKLGLRISPRKLDNIIAIWIHNCFEYAESPEGYAVFFLSSFFSHSCEPNAIWQLEDGKAVFRTRRPVAAGEEICISYLNEDDMMEATYARRKSLSETKHFWCACERCSLALDLSRGLPCEGCKAVIYMPTTTRPTKSQNGNQSGVTHLRCEKCQLEHSVEALLREERQLRAQLRRFQKLTKSEGFEAVWSGESRAWALEMVESTPFHWFTDILCTILALELRKLKRWEEARIFLLGRRKFLEQAYRFPESNGALAWTMEELHGVEGRLGLHRGEDPHRKLATAVQILWTLFGERNEYYEAPAARLRELRSSAKEGRDPYEVFRTPHETL